MTTRALWHPAHLHPGTLRAPVTLDRLAGAGRRAFATIRTWNRRRRERDQLSALNDRMLSDIGITRADAVFLSSKPFWKE
jgi:uncharacterized protein YjiS (DUF1127 family)